MGDEVRADDNVMEIETDKTTVGVPTPVSGVVEEIYVQDGDTVKAGQDLFKIKPGAVSEKPAATVAAAPEASKPPAAAVKMDRFRLKIYTTEMLTNSNEIDMRYVWIRCE